MDTIGRSFRLSIFGESHGPCVGVVIDGCPAGLPLGTGDFETDLARRRGGREGTTPRKEVDIPQFQSGVFEGHTTGAPLCITFMNENVRSADYRALKDTPRPGHADLTGRLKFGGFNDYRGGGAFFRTAHYRACRSRSNCQEDHYAGCRYCNSPRGGRE